MLFRNWLLEIAEQREYGLVRKHPGMATGKEPYTGKREQRRDARRLVLKGRIWAFPYLDALEEERLIIPKIIFEMQQRLQDGRKEAGEDGKERFCHSPDELFLSLLLRCYGVLRRAFAFLFGLLVFLGLLGLTACLLILLK